MSAEVIAGIETDRGRGHGAGHRRLPGVPGEPAAGVEVPGAARRVRGQERRRGRAHAGGHGADRLAPAAAGSRDSAEAEGLKVLARTHKTLIWERTRAVQRLRHQLRAVLPRRAGGLRRPGRPDTLELLGKAPDPARAAKLTRAQVSAALKRARRRTSRTRPPRSSPRCAARSWASPRLSPPPTPPPSAP